MWRYEVGANVIRTCHPNKTMSSLKAVTILKSFYIYIYIHLYILPNLKRGGDVPGGPVAETLLPIQQGSGFDPWSGS